MPMQTYAHTGRWEIEIGWLEEEVAVLEADAGPLVAVARYTCVVCVGPQA